MSSNIGLFFGSFNPMHIGHLILVNHIVEYSNLDEVWLVVTPHNPHKQKKSLLPDYQRLEMVNLALEDYPKLRSSNIEFSLPQPSYTIDTLSYLSEKHPDKKFSLIMGEDNIATLHKWKNYKQITENYHIIVYPRIHNNPKTIIDTKHFTLIQAPVIEISSTQIRKMIQENKNYRPLVPEKVFQYLDGSSLYKSYHL